MNLDLDVVLDLDLDLDLQTSPAAILDLQVPRRRSDVA